MTELTPRLLRNAVSIGEGSAMVFLQRPMSLALLVVVLAVLVLPRVVQWIEHNPQWRSLSNTNGRLLYVKRNDLMASNPR